MQLPDNVEMPLFIFTQTRQSDPAFAQYMPNMLFSEKS